VPLPQEMPFEVAEKGSSMGPCGSAAKENGGGEGVGSGAYRVVETYEDKRHAQPGGRKHAGSESLFRG